MAECVVTIRMEPACWIDGSPLIEYDPDPNYLMCLICERDYVLDRAGALRVRAWKPIEWLHVERQIESGWRARTERRRRLLGETIEAESGQGAAIRRL